MATEMAGAELRRRNERAAVWLTAMLPHMKKTPSFDQFVGIDHDRHARATRWERAWDRVDAGLKRNRQ